MCTLIVLGHQLLGSLEDARMEQIIQCSQLFSVGKDDFCQ